MSHRDLLLRMVHVANNMQDEGADFRDTVYFPDHAALTLQDLDFLIELLKLALRQESERAVATTSL